MRVIAFAALHADCLCRAELQLDKFGFLYEDEYSTDHSIGTARRLPFAHTIRRGLQEDRSIQEST